MVRTATINTLSLSADMYATRVTIGTVGLNRWQCMLRAKGLWI